MTEVKTLNTKRGQVKAQLTRFKTFLEACEEEDIPQIPDRLVRAETLWAEFESVQTKIEGLVRETSPEGAERGEEAAKILEEQFNEERGSFEDAYYDTISKARRMMSRHTQASILHPPASPIIQREEEGISTHVKLPTLMLPSFNGNYDQWLLFKDSFKSLIHSNAKLTEIQKFQYLRSSLKDEALKVLQSLETSAENYEIGWSLLTQRYENKRLIINTHMKELFELTSVAKGNTQSLRQFIDSVKTHLRALGSLGQPVEKWDTILIHLLSNKIEFHTRRDWEIDIGNKKNEDMPTMKQWLEFLTNRCHTLELVEGTSSKQLNSKSTDSKKDKKVNLATTGQHSCAYCQGQHMIYRCEEFARLPVHSRQSEAVKRQLCINCLKKGHYARDCKGSKCRQCSRQHNTLLHQDRGTYSGGTKEEGKAPESATLAKPDQEDPKTVSVATVYCSQKQDELNRRWTYSEPSSEDTAYITHARAGESQVVLSTAQVYVFDSQGNPRRCRVLLDPGSQSNLITKSFANKLNLQSKRVDIPIMGINQGRSYIRELVKVKLKSIVNNYQAPIECLVLETITQPLPQVQLNPQVLNIPKDIRLADPTYDTPGEIDLLIGAGLFWQLLCVGRTDLGKELPILQKTLLGWVLGGEIKKIAQLGTIAACCLTLNQETDQALEKFWRMEEVIVKQYPTKEEKQCEQHYIETVKRASDGRFIVRLPMDSAVRLGDSRSGALRRLYTTERKLRAQPDLKEEYLKFLTDYEAMGHMTLVRGDSITDSQGVYYLPHQPVVRTTSLTTKLRVVFDGSAKTSLGTSLNNKLLTGPNLQEDIVDIILRFRCHQYVLTADVAKMFRQIMVAEADRDFQRILWRSDPCQPIQEYTLNTVTYGTSCAPYLAMRCLRQLAMEESSKMPRASKALLEDCYMDDILTGCETFTEAVELQQQLYKLLAKGRFSLRKWRCNRAEVLKHLTKENRTEDLMILDSGEPLKTLGLLWNAAEDNLQYSVSIEEGIKPTKRNILSQIARIYDPLGLLGPIMMNAKIIMQELWKLQLSWDESIPQSLYAIWCQYYSSLPRINQIKTPRNVNPRNTSGRIDLHGFSDASEKGYGACVYCTYTDTGGETAAHILCSKSRVAPLKSMSLPRLELSGALILARLISVIWKALGDRVRNTYLWSDSTIVLCWVGTQPHTLKTFVANKVAEIQELTPKIPWLYVPSSENPADMLSRGTSVSSLIENKLWWSGPPWLITSDKWPEQPVGRKPEILEQKINTMVVTYSPPYVLRKFSQYSKLQRVIAYCFRFFNNAKGTRKSGSLEKEELQNANIAILRMVQKEIFQLDLRQLQRHQELSNKSTLITLNPFLDDDGLIRVGGRLKHANIPETQRHPIVLPSKHSITTLIMQQEHRRLLHCGPELLLHSIRQQYWPLSGRREARKVTRNCLQCFRYRPTPMKTIMADMPKSRLEELSRPFDRCGIDYAGPFTIREGKRRGRVPTTKAYVAVFVCFATKALHLELVTSLTSEAFLAALRRFVSRRGTPSHIYSDNATNFVGANRELKELYVFLREQKEGIAQKLAMQDITWHFIPPRSPHFGGLWEAAVKSVKRHIGIAMRGLNYTYEEYNTLLIEIEGILNSRPLTPISSDPNDMTALTPSHFLIGDSLLQPAQRTYSEVPDNRLSRWQHLQKLRAHFWKRWRQEYLNQLQSRTRWTKGDTNLKIGSLVLMIDDNSPPLHWPMGRVLEVHPGEDNVARVATVKTSSGTFKRAIKKLCAIPNEL